MIDIQPGATLYDCDPRERRKPEPRTVEVRQVDGDYIRGVSSRGARVQIDRVRIHADPRKRSGMCVVPLEAPDA